MNERVIISKDHFDDSTGLPYRIEGERVYTAIEFLLNTIEDRRVFQEIKLAILVTKVFGDRDGFHISLSFHDKEIHVFLDAQPPVQFWDNRGVLTMSGHYIENAIFQLCGVNLPVPIKVLKYE